MYQLFNGSMSLVSTGHVSHERQITINADYYFPLLVYEPLCLGQRATQSLTGEVGHTPFTLNWDVRYD